MTVAILNYKTRRIVFNDDAERVMYLYDSTGSPKDILLIVNSREKYIYPAETHIIHSANSY